MISFIEVSSASPGNDIPAQLISQTSGLMDPDTVGKAALSGVCRGDLNIWCGLEGFGLSQISAGMTPPNSLLHGVFQVLSASLLKLISFFVVMQLDWVVKSNENKPYKRAGSSSRKQD
mmetsp:Transcript_16768/g.13983  ORF Transcript_16768/g.13983 Transcript_16768/m.13983 type:complete len:118 (+) Transcript_16768:230-583(+)